MAESEKQIFLSYRRSVGNWVARAVYQDLRGRGYDVFMDVESIDNGEFRPVILHQIEARPHFLVVLTPGSLARSVDPDDWLRREIEHALLHERNIVPLFAKDFTFEAEEESLPRRKLPGKLNQLKKHNGFTLRDDYFPEGMERLTKRFLKPLVSAPVKPTPVAERSLVERLMANAAAAHTDRLGGSWTWLDNKVLEAPKLERSVSGLAGRALLSDILATGGPLLGGWPGGRRWQWTAPIGAADYVLQKSAEASFAKPVELYKGAKTEFSESTLLATLADGKAYYRVKATGGPGFLDSPWSNVVEVAPPPKRPLPAPKLEQSFAGLTSHLLLTGILAGDGALGSGWPRGRSWKWTASAGAVGYVLQKSEEASFAKPVELYQGDQTAFEERTSLTLALPDGKTYYRVKATGGLWNQDSPWSNVVEVAPPPRLPLPAPTLEAPEACKPGFRVWKWGGSAGSGGYRLQCAEDAAFSDPTTLYDGPQTRFVEPTLGILFKHSYYRVRAVGGLWSLDSPWSNVVELRPLSFGGFGSLLSPGEGV